MHGNPCFAGTRVPVQTLIDFLETGDSIDGFLRVYPYIPREQVHAFLELSKDLTVEQVSCGSFWMPAMIRADAAQTSACDRESDGLP